MHLKFYLSARLQASCGGQISKSLEMHIYKLMLKIFFPFLRNRIAPVMYAYRHLLKKDWLYTSKKDENKRERQEYCRNSS